MSCRHSPKPISVNNSAYYIFDSTKSYYENFSRGYIDTFTIANTLFRIRSAMDTSNLFCIDKKSVNWKAIDTFFARQSSYYFSDLNKDGYPDLFTDYRFQQLVYLFDPSQKTFINTGFFSSDATDSLMPVSKTSGLYFDIFHTKYDNWWSYLYILKDYVRYNLGIIEYKIKYSDYPTLTNGQISIRKISSDTLQTELETFRIINADRFDIRGYWIKNISKFYTNQLMAPNKVYINYEPDFSNR